MLLIGLGFDRSKQSICAVRMLSSSASYALEQRNQTHVWNSPKDSTRYWEYVTELTNCWYYFSIRTYGSFMVPLQSRNKTKANMELETGINVWSMCSKPWQYELVDQVSSPSKRIVQSIQLGSYRVRKLKIQIFWILILEYLISQFRWCWCLGRSWWILSPSRWTDSLTSSLDHSRCRFMYSFPGEILLILPTIDSCIIPLTINVTLVHKYSTSTHGHVRSA